MGRPPLKLKDPTVSTTVRLPASLLARAKAVIAGGEVSEVIRALLETEVRRRERTKLKPD
ncbi:hypothetical protein [Methylobacterium pseudosasicola]|uniref:Uncharacterized protein n=1 Tax=Methylobacterium pseudosasicola TaxID=582667 RepID=A0A1I4TZT6_9HYPH|nr:hypothetical protein [Methylobacterium pseudosasicola]SFM82145.1 hypothetical protein SAMN05192568_10612 [Methylobacterium pseudosasicola]